MGREWHQGRQEQRAEGLYFAVHGYAASLAAHILVSGIGLNRLGQQPNLYKAKEKPGTDRKFTKRSNINKVAVFQNVPLSSGE